MNKNAEKVKQPEEVKRPPEEAKRLEGLVQSKNASIVLSVPKNGKAQVKDLLINGLPWRDQ